MLGSRAGVLCVTAFTYGTECRGLAKAKAYVFHVQQSDRFMCIFVFHRGVWWRLALPAAPLNGAPSGCQ